MQVMVEREAEDFLEKAGFDVARREFCTTPMEAVKAAKKLKYPIAMKVVSQKILHKSDVGGVALDIKSDSEIKKTFNSMKKLKGFEGVLIQDYTEGAFVLLGLKKDPTFGHVVVVGAGGIYTEMLKDVSFRVCPITNDDAKEMLKELKFYDVLKGVRGEKYNLKKVRDTLVALSRLAKNNPKIKELDINPMILSDSDARIVDARIVFE
tara:strand:+ start:13402 stop:14025 length:624 start_codon:yes stop_codon:yes gene_type:complete